jgi:hypothetical protein
MLLLERLTKVENVSSTWFDSNVFNYFPAVTLSKREEVIKARETLINKWIRWKKCWFVVCEIWTKSETLTQYYHVSTVLSLDENFKPVDLLHPLKKCEPKYFEDEIITAAGKQNLLPMF